MLDRALLGDHIRPSIRVAESFKPTQVAIFKIDAQEFVIEWELTFLAMLHGNKLDAALSLGPDKNKAKLRLSLEQKANGGIVLIPFQSSQRLVNQDAR